MAPARPLLYAYAYGPMPLPIALGLCLWCRGGRVGASPHLWGERPGFSKDSLSKDSPAQLGMVYGNPLPPIPQMPQKNQELFNFGAATFLRNAFFNVLGSWVGGLSARPRVIRILTFGVRYLPFWGAFLVNFWRIAANAPPHPLIPKKMWLTGSGSELSPPLTYAPVWV